MASGDVSFIECNDPGHQLGLRFKLIRRTILLFVRDDRSLAAYVCQRHKPRRGRTMMDVSGIARAPEAVLEAVSLTELHSDWRDEPMFNDEEQRQLRLAWTPAVDDMILRFPPLLADE